MFLFFTSCQRLEIRFKSILVRLVVGFIITTVVVACGGSESPEFEPVIEQQSDLGTASLPHPVVITVIAADGSELPLPESSVQALGPTSSPTNFSGQETPLFTQLPETIEATPTPEPTAGPTFTPPASPVASSAEHFWLHRPVPDGNGVWTDKAYPYGSNRGGTLRTHHGVEFNVPSGTDVLASADGTVVFAGSDASDIQGPINDFYGNVIVIQHGFGIDGEPIFTLYGHLSEIRVSVGQHVRSQELIAYSGASGVADGAHLHFEVRQGENSYSSTRNPLLWLYPFPDRGVVAGRISQAEGQSAQGYPVTLRRIDAPSAYAGTTTYADESVNPDNNWRENFTFDDVIAGYYELAIGSGEDRVTAEFWVFPNQTTFIEMTLPG